MTQLSSSIDVPQLTRLKVEHHHHHHGDCTHTHGVIDPEIASSALGIWAVKWSLVGLLLTAIVQAAVFWLSGSVALLADIIHNVGDAMTAVPLGVAFLISRRKPTPFIPSMQELLELVWDLQMPMNLLGAMKS
ncbi:putative Co/Zn/Cd cation transporter [Rivularia sp. PCC 7116]|uniref:cation transporter n=1 Tax=Rivularia sp. PCC 7116 TaxID=373994 RepID=UPI00029EEDE0|nr:cation transporter [Rivularia sp. PCC 7116]AFY54180.1 putative Co/Zn/Cd cation transporter [Rivularia sp. PCC 7116]